MKRFLIICLVTWTFLPMQASTPGRDLFSYDAVKISRELNTIEELEKLVTEAGTSTYPVYNGILYGKSENPCTITVSNTTASHMASVAASDIPPFVWGCLLSGFGVALVYNTTHNNEDTKKAFMGCIVNGIVLTSVYIINILVNY